MDHALQTALLALADDLRQRRRLRLLVRATWLAALVIAAGLAWQLLGHALSWRALLGAALATLLLGAAYALLSDPLLVTLVRSFDRHYKLQQQLGTALEVAQQPPRGLIAQRLVTQATLTLRQVRQQISRRPLVPWREWETLAALLLLIAGLALAHEPGLPRAATPLAVPALPSPMAVATAAPPASDQPVAATPEPLSPAAQQAAEALAEALADTGATRPASDALRQGDAQGAAAALRDLAQQGQQLGAASREELARDLGAAADRLRPTQPERAAALDQIAGELPDRPAEALGQLAEAVEQLGQDQKSGGGGRANRRGRRWRRGGTAARRHRGRRRPAG